MPITNTLAIVIPTGFGLTITGLGYLISKVIDTDKIVTTHIAEDVILFETHRKALEVQAAQEVERHGDIKDRLVRIENKLDMAKIVLEDKESHDNVS